MNPRAHLAFVPAIFAALFIPSAPSSLEAQIPLNPLISNNATCPVLLPGLYVLTNNVEWSSTNTNATTPIAILASDVVVDLQGKTIRAAGSATNLGNGAGIGVGGLLPISNIVVSNGTIEGFREYGIFVTGVQNSLFSDLLVRDTGAANSPSSPLPSPLPAGFHAMLSGNVTLSNVTVSNVICGTNATLSAGVSALLCSNFTAVNGIVTGLVGTDVSVLQTNNAIFGFASLESVGTTCSNLTVTSVYGREHYKDVTGIAMIGSSGALVSGGSVSGVTNEGGTAQGINGGLGTVGMTVQGVMVSGIRTGQLWTNNPLGHTALGMVFAPSGRPVRAGILGATVTNGGRGYTSAPTVTIAALTNDPGSGATARAIVSGGKVREVQILSPGTNYIAAPNVVFSGGGGSGAAAIVMPHQVAPYTTFPCGNITVGNCVISNVVGGIDDAHGISFFVVTNVIADNVRVHGVLDGTNTLGPGGSTIGGSKATGIESYGNPAVEDSAIWIRNCSAEDIQAVGPGDLAALGFSAAGGGIRFVGCTASNVTVTGTNRLNPRAKPGYGYGFGWAPDIRVVYQYPAWGARLEDCTATRCDVGFETFNFQDSVWIDPVSTKNRIAYLKQSSQPFQPKGTKRVLYGAFWNEVFDAPLYPNGIKPVPVWNNAVGNWIERNGRWRRF